MYYCVSVFFAISALSINLFSQNLGEITIYNTNNSELTYNQINTLEFDSENRLWIGTENGLSIFEYQNNNWANLDSTSTPWCYLPTNTITALEWSEDLSMMFVGTTNGIINYSDAGGTISDESPGPGTWYPAFGNSCYPNNSIINCLFYNNGLWAGSSDGLCVEYLGPEGDWLLQNTQTGFFSNNITSITKNLNNDVIAIGTMNGGLVTYDNEFNIYYSSNSNILDNTIFDVTFDQNNNIIITTPQAGLGVLTENGSWVWFNSINSTLTTNSLKKIIVDSNNDLWITTLENGLIHYKDNIFYNYTIENSNLPDNKINCVTLGPNNCLWLGTDTAGLVKIDTPIMSNYDNMEIYTKIFPSTFNTKINIDVLESASAHIYNQYGLLMDKKILSAGNNYINTSNYTSGVYFIVTQSNNKKSVNKVMKPISSNF